MVDHIGAPVGAQRLNPLTIHLPAHGPEKAGEDALSALAPFTHVGDLDGVSGAWSVLRVVAIWGDEPEDGRSLYISPFLSLPLSDAVSFK